MPQGHRPDAPRPRAGRGRGQAGVPARRLAADQPGALLLITLFRWARARTRRYLAPLDDALAAWLAPWRHKKGPVIPAGRDNERRVARFTEKLGKWTGLPWKKNGLRASYISYRYAQCGDAGAVAGECNTSADEVRKEYRDIHTLDAQLVTKDLAAAWFALLPADQSKVVHGQFRGA